MAECYHVGPVEDPCRYIVAEAKPLATDSGQGSVFRATTIQDGREIAVALKQLHGVGPDDLDRIVRRLRPLEGLSHPHLAEHIEAFVGPPLDVVTSTPDEFDLVYVASRWVEGPMLADAAAYAPGLRCQNWIVEVGWAAAHLHSVRSTDSPNGLIHRDIKPSNMWWKRVNTRSLSTLGWSGRSARSRPTPGCSRQRGWHRRPSPAWTTPRHAPMPGPWASSRTGRCAASSRRGSASPSFCARSLRRRRPTSACPSRPA